MNLKFLLATLLQYLRTPWTAAAGRCDNELKQELEFHLMSSASDLHESGMSIEESQSEAIEKFGDLKKVLRDCGDVTSSGQLVWQRAHLVITTGLVICVAALFAKQLQPIPRPDVGRLSMATGFSLEETHGDVLGEVSSSVGEAISNANVIVVVKTWPEGGYRQQSYMTTTDSDGSFCIEDVYPPDHNYEVQVSVVAEGRLLNSRYADMRSGILEPFDFKLETTNPFEIRFQSETGEPLEHVAVFPSSRTDQDGNRHQVYLMGAAPIARRSNKLGTIPITEFSRGEQVAIAIQFPGEDEWQIREFTVPEDNQVVVMTPTAL